MTDVAMDSGFESESGFRSAFARVFGAPPRTAASGDPILLDWVPSPVGPLVLGASEAGLCLLEFSDRHMETQFADLLRRFHAPLVPGRNRWIDAACTQLGEYFGGKRRAFDLLPLDIRGTHFQERVWQALLEIPYGETRSYRDIATRVGTPGATRAVGTANGRNRIAIVIPCHRVVNADGRLGGYGGGMWRKQHLLDLERGTRAG